MGTNYKQTKSKANTMALAWGHLAKDDSFGGYTLAQFQLLLADAQSKSASLEALDAGYTDAMRQRDVSHEALNEAMLNVVDGVKGDAVRHGANSSLYKAMGYVTRDERSSGLTRKATTTVGAGETSTGTANPPVNVPVAAGSASS